MRRGRRARAGGCRRPSPSHLAPRSTLTSVLVLALARRVLDVLPLDLVEAHRPGGTADLALVAFVGLVLGDRGLVERSQLDLFVLGRRAEMLGILLVLPRVGARRQAHDVLVVLAAQVPQLLAQFLRLAALLLQAVAEARARAIGDDAAQRPAGREAHERRKHHPDDDLACRSHQRSFYPPSTLNSMRRFFRRPASVELGAIGLASPLPLTINRLVFTPRFTRNTLTEFARALLSRRFAFASPTLSVYPPTTTVWVPAALSGATSASSTVCPAFVIAALPVSNEIERPFTASSMFFCSTAPAPSRTISS